MTRKRVIARSGVGLPWNIGEEKRHYMDIIRGKTIVMGRKTFAEMRHPFAGGHDIVVTRAAGRFENTDVCRTIDEAIAKAKEYGPDAYVIGGGQIFRQVIGFADRMLLSYIKKEYSGDIFFPRFSMRDWKVDKEEDFSEFTYVEYSRRG